MHCAAFLVYSQVGPFVCITVYYSTPCLCCISVEFSCKISNLKARDVDLNQTFSHVSAILVAVSAILL